MCSSRVPSTDPYCQTHREKSTAHRLSGLRVSVGPGLILQFIRSMGCAWFQWAYGLKIPLDRQFGKGRLGQGWRLYIYHPGMVGVWRSTVRHGVCESLVFTWRRQVRDGLLTAPEMPVFLPVRRMVVVYSTLTERILPRRSRSADRTPVRPQPI